MAYSCKNCGEVCEAKLKSGCGKCGKNKGFALVTDKSTTDVVASYKWETYASSAAVTIVSFTDFKSIGGVNSLPDSECLQKLYLKALVPSIKGKKMVFNVYVGNYADSTLTGSYAVTDKEEFTVKAKASLCAEALMWDHCESKIGTKKYMAVGQSKCPCDLCCARYAGLAKDKSITIIVCYDEGYDKRPAGHTFVFSSTGAIYLSSGKL